MRRLTVTIRPAFAGMTTGIAVRGSAGSVIPGRVLMGAEPEGISAHLGNVQSRLPRTNLPDAITVTMPSQSICTTEACLNTPRRWRRMRVRARPSYTTAAMTRSRLIKSSGSFCKPLTTADREPWHPSST